MHPPDCPFWEYDPHPDRISVLKERTSELLVKLHERKLDTLDSASDTRSVHQFLFERLTPPDFEYYAGHYRGEDFRCLEFCEVMVDGDPRVGAPAAIVRRKMRDVADLVQEGFTFLDQAHALPDAKLSAADKLLNTVAFACGVFEELLRIHPYMNGNGHAARFVVWVILGRYGYFPEAFPIDPRPDYPLYTQAIVEYRNGNPFPLEQYLLRCVTGDD